jgi:hypothetical protein
MNKSLFAICLIPLFLFGIEEKNWGKTWPKDPIEGTEHLSLIEPEDMESAAITYALDRGRFGDQLANYIKALWVSWKYDLPFLYRPFDYSRDLMLSKLHENQFNSDAILGFSSKVEFIHNAEKVRKVFTKLSQNDPSKSPESLCVISFLTPLDEEWEDEKWNEPGFQDYLRTLVKPIDAHEELKLPKDAITVALHVRTGVGYDWQVNIDTMPTKFPPDSFYLKGIEKIANHFPESSLYIRIFTDDPDPISIRDRYASQLSKAGVKNVEFDCRLTENKHDMNVLEDLFAMSQFDCLIRPDSSFSRCAAVLSAPLIEIKPTKWGKYRKTNQGDILVDPVMIFRSDKGGPITDRRLEEI